MTMEGLPHKIRNHEQFVKHNLDILGVFNSPAAFTGPRIVQIDLTNDCNNDCIGCWCYSPLLGERRMRGAIKRKRLPLEVINAVITDLADMGTEEIILAGSGEPFMHLHILDILELISDKGIRCNLITNFTLVDEEIAKKLVDLNVDTITASIWAGSAEAYVKTHPSKTERTFHKIEEMLHRIHRYKESLNKRHPKIKITNVVLNLNCDDIEDMVDFAIRTQADLVEFNVIDIVDGKTDCLALSPADCQLIISQLSRIKERADYTEVFCIDLLASNLDGAHKREIAHFGSLIRVPENFHLDFSKFGLTCPRGQTADRYYVDYTSHSLFFQFNQELCRTCSESSCGLDKTDFTKHVPTLNLSNCSAFHRRVSAQRLQSTGLGSYDRYFIDTLPCYIGWIYSRILVSGNVVPCCKAHLVPMGNVYSQSSKDIWFSDKQNEFRGTALKYKKSHPYFEKIDCYKVCDNLAMNLDLHRRIVDLSATEKRHLNDYSGRL